APPTCYGAPMIAPDRAVAAALIDHVRGRARACGATRVRISAYDDEPGKRAALLAAGFAPLFDFVTVGCDSPHGARWSRDWPRIRTGEVDPARWSAVHNGVCAGVPNPEPLDPAEMARLLAHPLTCRAATAAYGDYDGFVHVEHEPGFATIAAIGVRAAHRG